MGLRTEIDEDNITQLGRPANAPAQLRDYLNPEVDHANWKIDLELSDAELAARIRGSRQANSPHQAIGFNLAFGFEILFVGPVTDDPLVEPARPFVSASRGQSGSPSVLGV